MAKQTKRHADGRTERKPRGIKNKANNMRALSLRYRGVILTFILDIGFCLASFWAARAAMFKEVSFPVNYTNFEIPIMIIMTAIPVCLLALFNCYNVMWKFAGRIEFIKFVGSYIVSVVILFIVKAILDASFNVQLWGTQIVIYIVIALVLTSIPRFSSLIVGYVKHVRRGNLSSSASEPPKRTIIYGAGNVGSVLNNRFIDRKSVV